MSCNPGGRTLSFENVLLGSMFQTQPQVTLNAERSAYRIPN